MSRYLEGRLVEITAQGTGPDPNAERGQCVEWSEDEQKFLVQTFDGRQLLVDADKLKEFFPAAPEHGGFDVAWPVRPADEMEFADAVMEHLQRKGYCMVQTSLSDTERREAVEEASSRSDFDRLSSELDVPYLGSGDAARVSKLDAPPADLPPTGVLEMCDQGLEALTELLTPLAPRYLGCDIFERTPCLARVPALAHHVSEPLWMEEVEDGQIEEAISFMRRRRLAMLHLLQAGEGAEAELLPLDAGDGLLERTRLPLRANCLLLFRHDVLSYAIRQSGPGASLAVQAWALDAPLDAYFSGEMLVGSAERTADIMGLTGPVRPDLQGKRTCITALLERMPGQVYGRQQAWSMFCAGGDTAVRWPRTRWDEESYYSEDYNAAAFGKTYSVHGAFMEIEEVTQFDHEFFNIPHEEARWMAAEQRLILETGFETLVQGGYTRASLRGKRIGVFMGDVGSEELLYQVPTKYTYDGLQGGIAAARLSHCVGLTGPAVSHDTACSSALMAFGFAHWKMQDSEDPLPTALAGGVNLHMTPMRYIGLGSGGFLTKKGRCFTFDQSAEGYLRGEGCGTALMQLKGDEADADLTSAEAIGAALNQDGRSASLTAPNGPSQQACIKMSMRMGKITPDIVTSAECHGTGTALGDPIELGALTTTMGPRDLPLYFTTSKINLGHTEAHAGMAGIAKCILMVQTTAVPPHNHLSSLSSHLHLEGFPSCVNTEFADPGRNSQCMGVSSFGFGGSNARTDFWGRSTAGLDRLREQCDYLVVPCPRCAGSMCLQCSVAVPALAPAGKHRCSLLREEGGSYDLCSDCYDGRYRYGDKIPGLANTNQRVYITGTWNAWTGMHEMEKQSADTYVYTVELGETLAEQFHLVLDQDRAQEIFPAIGRAGTAARIDGPGVNDGKFHWLIDGRRDNARAGAVYRVTFKWGDSMEIKWEPASAHLPRSLQDGAGGYRHTYFITGSFAAWNELPMARAGGSDAGVHKASFRIGASGTEEFHIVRDRDPQQVIYPARERAADEDVPLRGPDDAGAGKNWLVSGREREEVKVLLKVVDGELELTMTSEGLGKRTWSGSAGGRSYYVAGSCSDWNFHEMAQKPEAPGVHRCSVTMGMEGVEEFQIVADKDWAQTLYPPFDGASSGEAVPQGPGLEQDGASWRIRGREGDSFEIVLDWNQADRRKVVRWRNTADPELDSGAPEQKGAALLFPGQGSQYVRMLEGLKDEPAVQELVRAAEAVLGYDLLAVCLEGPEDKLAETSVCQPAVFLAGMAGLEKLRRERAEVVEKPGAVAGLSLGEYTALCAAGVFTFEEGMELVKVRGEAMAEAAALRPQAMLSVAGLDRETLEELCAREAQGDEVCQIANVLFPKGFACAGTAGAIQRLKPAAEAAGAAQARELKTSGGFHTALMEPAKVRLEEALRGLLPRMRPPRCDVYMNITGKRVRAGTPPSELVPLLSGQLVSEVQWSPAVSQMIKDGLSEFFEVGPQKQLKAMMKRIDQDAWGATESVLV